MFPRTYFGTEIFPKGEIRFENFCLRYRPDTPDVLRHLSFVIKPGEKIGIVGRTGSGKSTMMLGLLRIIEAWEGRIVIDGKDISKLSLEELRSNINIILQDHFMFTGTVKENVDPTGSHTDEQVEEALKLCGVWESFTKDGVNSHVAEGGDNLSAGEKQLLNITRSLLNPKRVVLIDEATASIDFETDAQIQKVIKKQFADKTVLTIAHRINTVVNSDRILVLSKG
ncbi:MAG: ATP-binding cassette domain-containing protein [Bdellovibrionales bacterium]|nr:ATP-binding cassette domain-containing protein [Bdellovibrionales bacterium]